ncbi:hypothetical protein [Pectobacterium versatile]|uniref:hypothetical protein n=1 Tax=Pectobacterium versatile TaxID=2488639 RepID=UPI0015E0097C|nr:hypothetical protein [Pectobacterium versatile]MBA0170452.1 hypothetical protein [Pectobacterium versatile]
MKKPLRLPQEANENSITIALRNVSPQLDSTITDLAFVAGKPKATFVKEFLEKNLSDHIRNFGMKNSLVSSLDHEIAAHIGAELLDGEFHSEQVSYWNQEYRRLLNIGNEDDLRRILMANVPFLIPRADQVLSGYKRIPRGISVTFCLFSELASCSGEIIDEAWRNIFYSPLPDRQHRFYLHIDQIRALKKLSSVSGALSWTNENVTVNIWQPGEYQYGAWRVLICLGDNVNEPQKAFSFPELQRRLLLPDTDYQAVTAMGLSEPSIGFRFRARISEMHLYSNGVAENDNPVSLEQVARALIQTVTQRL